MTKSIVLAGVGGQGTVLASRLIAAVALERGVPVRTAETIGMAQRGGTVFSHVRYGDGPDDVPATSLVPKGGAQLVISFEPGEALRALEYLAPGGAMVVARKALRPVTATLSGDDYNGVAHLEHLAGCVENLVVVDGDQICLDCGNPKVLNVALLGAAVATGMLGADADEVERAIEKLVKPRFVEVNRQALYAGMLAAQTADHTARRWQS